MTDYDNTESGTNSEVPIGPRFMQTVNPSGAEQTMSSREIAQVCEKRHSDVRRDIRNMINELELGLSTFAHTYFDSQNKAQEEYLLPKDLTFTLVSGYNIRLRKRIIDRWLELEAAPTILPDFTNPAVAARAWADEVEAKQYALTQAKRLEGQVAEQKPQVEAYKRIAVAEGSMCITDAAKTLQVKPKDLFTYLRANGWIYKRAGATADIGYQSKIMVGLLEHKTTIVPKPDGTEKVCTQVRVTPKGLARLANDFPPVLEGSPC